MAADRQPAENRRRQRPARSPETREKQLISLAVDLAEKQLLEGTASAQVITHYLKMGSPREQLDRQKLESENKLAQARVEQISSGSRLEELTEEAIRAFKAYSGSDNSEEDDVY